MLAQCRADGGQGEIHLIPDAAVVWDQGRFVWVGAENDLPENYANREAFDADGALVLPGLVDCHTHLAFGGWRADEFVQKVLGVPYLEIAGKGGGILSTVRETRLLSEEALRARSAEFLEEMLELGVTTVECKSGYGLGVDDELKILRVYRELAKSAPQRLVSTLLAAHTIPSEFKDNREGYLRLIEEELLPKVREERLATFFDVFMEKGAFTRAETERLCRAAIKSGLQIKLHVDQLSSGGGAELAGELNARSADHLEYITESGIKALARSKTVAVTLPLATLYTRQPPLQARPLIEAGVRVAVATDFNPGTAPSYHLPLAMLLACTLNRLTPAEAVKGATIIAAEALGLAEEIGSIEVGKGADLCVIEAESVEQWLYQFRANACLLTFRAGNIAYRRPQAHELRELSS